MDPFEERHDQPPSGFRQVQAGAGHEPLMDAPPPRRRRRRGRLILAGALVAAAVALAAGSLAQMGNHAPAASGLSKTSPPVRQTSAPARPLTAKAIAARVDPGLVDVNVVFGLQSARGAGTGMVLTPSGVVLTNNHVIQGASSVSVTDVGNGRTYQARVVGYSRQNDVAVLQLQGASGLQTVPLGDSSQLAAGDRVTALGNARGRGGTPSIARGRVVALSQSITAVDAGGGNAERLHGLIQTDAPIQPGDSGGPLVNASGLVVGMDAAASAHYVQQSTATQGFAIPINTALSVTRQIQAGVESRTVHTGPTAFLGVQLVPAQQFGEGAGAAQITNGAPVGGVLHGYPAETAGLKAGDTIVAVDGQPVPTASALSALLSTHHPGDTVQLRWIDQTGASHSASVTLTSGPPA